MRIRQDIERKFSAAVIREHRVAGQSGGEKLLGDGSDPLVKAKNHIGETQIPQGRRKTAAGRLKSHRGGEKLLQGGSNPVGEAKNCFGMAQIPLGKQEFAMGALKINYEDEKLLRGGSNPVGEVRDCFGAAQIERGRADERCGKRQMRTSEMRTKVEGDKLATALLTIKYDNSPAERIVEPTKKAHLSVSKTGGERNNKSRLTTNKIDTEKNRPEAQSSWLKARGLQPKNDECRLTTNNKDTTNKLVARGWWPRRAVGISATLQLTAQKINPYSLVLPGKRTVTNKLIKQSCAYET